MASGGAQTHGANDWTVRTQTGIVEKCYMPIIEQCHDRPAAADEMVPFEKLPIFPVGGVIQHNQTWPGRFRRPEGLLLSQ